MNDLIPLVTMAQRYPDLLASTIQQYQIQHDLDDTAIVAYLGLASMDRLHLLCLCERPSNEIYTVFINDIEKIARYARCDFRALARVVVGSTVHLVWRKDHHQDLWTCAVNVSETTFQAVVARVDPTSYAGYVDGPHGRTWLKEHYTTCEVAQYQGEMLLDALMLNQSSAETR